MYFIRILKFRRNSDNIWDMMKGMCCGLLDKKDSCFNLDFNGIWYREVFYNKCFIIIIFKILIGRFEGKCLLNLLFVIGSYVTFILY